MELLINKEQKLRIPYKVTTLHNSTKDVDINKRVVTGMFNTSFFIDHDMDMLLPKAAKKSIKERGVGTNSGNKIKHLKDHEWSNVIARLDVLDERKVSFKGKEVEGIYHESFYPNATDSNDLLIKIQEGLYDDRSIGFQYVDLALASRDSENSDERKRFNKFIEKAMNPEVGEKAGFFWVVPEIKLFEGSDVAFGANELTPFLGMKNKGDSDRLKNKLFEKLDIIGSLFKTGNLTDEGFQQMEMEKLQIKMYISALTSMEPLKKGTIEPDSRNKKALRLI